MERNGANRAIKILMVGLLLGSLFITDIAGSSLASPSTAITRRLDVPYIHQTYDTPDDFNGSWACAPTSAVAVLAYY